MLAVTSLRGGDASACMLAAREQATDGGDAALRAGERQPGARARHQQDRAAQRPRHGESRSRM